MYSSASLLFLKQRVCWSCLTAFLHFILRVLFSLLCFVSIKVKHELNFLDKDTQFYRFQDSQFGLNHILNEKDSEDELQEALSLLSQLGPDALLTMILRKWSVCLVVT